MPQKDCSQVKRRNYFSLFGSHELHLNRLSNFELLCRRERLKTGGSPRKAAETVTELENAKMYKEMQRQLCLAWRTENETAIQLLLSTTYSEVFKKLRLFFFTLEVHRFFLLAFFEDMTVICFLTVLRNLPQLLSLLKDN